MNITLKNKVFNWFAVVILLVNLVMPTMTTLVSAQEETSTDSVESFVVEQPAVEEAQPTEPVLDDTEAQEQVEPTVTPNNGTEGTDPTASQPSAEEESSESVETISESTESSSDEEKVLTVTDLRLTQGTTIEQETAIISEWSFALALAVDSLPLENGYLTLSAPSAWGQPQLWEGAPFAYLAERTINDGTTATYYYQANLSPGAVVSGPIRFAIPITEDQTSVEGTVVAKVLDENQEEVGSSTPQVAMMALAAENSEPANLGNLGINFVTKAELRIDGEAKEGTPFAFDIDFMMLDKFDKDVPLKPGDFFDVALPSGYFGDLAGDYEYATVSMVDGNLRFTMKDTVEGKSNIGGEITLRGKLQLGDFVQPGPVKIPFPVKDNAEYTINFEIKPTNSGSVISKKGQLSEDKNEITWTIIANGNGASLTNATLTDTLPDTLTFKEGSSKIITRNAKGNPIGEPQVGPKPTVEGQIVTFELGDTKSEYEITLITTITEKGKTSGQHTIENTAILNAEGEDAQPATDRVRYDVFNKMGSKTGVLDKSKGIITWTVEYNKSNESLTSFKLVDILGLNHTYDTTSFKVKENQWNTGNRTLPGLTSTFNSNSLVINYEGDAINETLYFEYQTKIDDDFVLFKNTEFTNTVTDGEVPATGSVWATPSLFRKNGEYDSINNRIKWTIVVNEDNIEMRDVIVTDTYTPAELELDEVTVNGETVNGVTASNGKFTLALGNFSNRKEIIYYTNYTDDLIREIVAGKTVSNKAELDWKDKNDQPHKNPHDPVYPWMPSNVKNNGTKSGQYDDKTKEIAWTIKVNENKRPLNEASLTDVIPVGQSYVADSLTIDKEVTSKEEPSNANSQTLQVTFPEGSEEIYTITFKTNIQQAGKIIQKQYSNIAKLHDGKYKTDIDLPASVNVNNGDKVISKSGKQEGAFITWTIKINEAGSHLFNAKVTDALGANALYIDGSFSLKGADGTNITIDEAKSVRTPVVEGINQGQTLVLELGEIKQPYTLTYQTEYIGDPKAFHADITNKIAFEAEGIETRNNDGQNSFRFAVNDSSGSTHAEDGRLKIKKAGDHGEPLAGVEIQLINSKGIVVATDTTDANGEITFKGRRYGKYTVKETKTLPKYEISSDYANGFEQEITAIGEGETVAELPMINEKVQLDIPVKKVWEDAGHESERPAFVTVDLIRQLGEEDAEVADTIELNQDNQWEYTFSDMDKYATKVRGENAEEYTYYVQEVVDDNYKAVVTPAEEGEPLAFIITNTYNPAPKETEVTVIKKWEDNENQDGIRPDKIMVRLLANDEIVGEPIPLEAKDDWTATITELPITDENKVPIEYTVEEFTVEGYEAAVTGSMEEGFTITNTHTPELIEVAGTKTWDDAENQDGKRPTRITVNLLANGEKVTEKEVTAANNWTYSFTDLPKYQAGQVGQAIDYTVTEDEVVDYTVAYVADSYDITNTYVPEVVTVSGTKTWNDADNQDGIRPASITVNLLADNVKIAEQQVKADEAGKWTYSFENLAKYQGGKLITYTVTEDAVATYTPDYVVDSFDIINTHTPGETSVNVLKVWDDLSNQYGLRPEKVEVQLLADGQPQGDPVTLSDVNNWRHNWIQLAEKAKGEEIEYSVKEVTEVAGYTTNVAQSEAGFTITNTYRPTPSVSVGDYVWFDENKDGLQDDTDVPIAGVVLTIEDSKGNPVTDIFGNLVKPTTTDADGKYLFENLPINEIYTVRIDKEASAKALTGYVPTLHEVGGDKAVDSSTWSTSSRFMDTDKDHDPTLDFGFVKVPEKPTTPSVSVGDYVWFDENKDGLQDDTDVPIAGVVLTIEDSKGNPVTDIFGNLVKPTTTDANGKYLFENLPINETYIVRIDREASAKVLTGYVPTLHEVGGDKAVDSSTWSTSSRFMDTDKDHDPTLDFGFVKVPEESTAPSVSVGDYVWFDENKDGLQDDTDVPIAGVVLTIEDSKGNPVTDIFGNLVKPTTTDANGKYLFENLPINETYTVRIDKEASAKVLTGYVPTLHEVGGDKAVDSSTWSTSSRFMDTDKDHDPTLDFGFVKVPENPKKVSVGDYVWVDKNKDGRQDEGEPGIPSVVLVITDDEGNPVTDIDGKVVQPTTTDANGFYEFTNLPADKTYKVSIDREKSAKALEPYVPTKENVGSSDKDSSTWTATSRHLVEDGDHDPTLDFGFVEIDEVKTPDKATTKPSTDSTKQLPKTGERSMSTYLVLIVLVMGIGLVVVGRKRQKSN